VATVFRLADYAQTAGTIVDLHAGTLKLEAESWSSRTAPMEGSYKYTKFGAQPKFDHLGVMVENFGLIGDDTVANLITGHNKIMAVIEKARLYHEDPLQSESWWLEANANGESAKRALLYEGSLQALTGVGLDPLMATKKLRLGCSLSRHPLWESTAKTEIVIGLSGVAVEGAAVAGGGTAPSRIAVASVMGASGGGIFDTVWMGIRPTYAGTQYFKSLCYLADGTLGTDTALVYDATGLHPGNPNVPRCTFATVATEANRVTITMIQVAPTDYTHMCGRYLLLLRARVSEGTVAVRLKFGGATDAAWVSQTPVYITSTNWHLYETGEITIPATGMQVQESDLHAVANAYTGDVRNSQWEIWAERVSGAGSIDLDGIMLIPSGHMIYAKSGLIQYAYFQAALHIYTNERDEVRPIYVDASSYPSEATTWYARDWYIPAAGGLLVSALDNSTASNSRSHLAVLFGNSYPRWYNFRG
jgi:hypothetical protein